MNSASRSATTIARGERVGRVIWMSPSCGNPQQPMRIVPDNLLEDLRRRGFLEDRQRLARHALPRQTRRGGGVRLADAGAVAVSAAAIAAHHQLVLMALQEVGRERRIAR